MKLTRLFVSCGLVLVASCGSDKTTSPTVGVSGSMSYTYTGGGSGTFNATGAIPSNTGTGLGTTAWAAATTDASAQSLDVIGAVPKGTNSWDYTLVEVAGLTTGTKTISATCSANVCNEVLVIIGSNSTQSNFQFFCNLTSGSITVAAISSTHASGTFSGSGTCTSAAGATSVFTVTNGNFDVGIYNGTLP